MTTKFAWLLQAYRCYPNHCLHHCEKKEESERPRAQLPQQASHPPGKIPVLQHHFSVVRKGGLL